MLKIEQRSTTYAPPRTVRNVSSLAQRPSGVCPPGRNKIQSTYHPAFRSPWVGLLACAELQPTDLTADQAASVNTHPLIKRLERDLRGLRQGSKKYGEARRKLRNEKQNLKRAFKQKIRDEWTAEQAVDDMLWTRPLDLSDRLNSD